MIDIDIIIDLFPNCQKQDTLLHYVNFHFNFYLFYTPLSPVRTIDLFEKGNNTYHCLAEELNLLETSLYWRNNFIINGKKKGLSVMNSSS